MADEREASILLQMRDELTSGLQRVEKGMKEFQGTAGKTTGSAKGLGMSLSGLKGVLSGLGGLWVVQKGVQGIGASMKMAASQEVSMMKLGVILKDNAKAQEYFNWAMAEANKTPFENGEMFKAVEGMTPFAKTTEDMKKYVQMAEVLATMNEEEGLNGAVFAMKEALSGDFTSLAERFNLPRSTINRLKEGKSTSAEFYEVVKQAAAEMGFGYDMVGKYAETGIGLWSTMTGTAKNWATELGKGFNQVLLPGLKDSIKWMDENDSAMKQLAKNIGINLGGAVKAIADDLKAWGDEAERFMNFISPVINALDQLRKEKQPVRGKTKQDILDEGVKGYTFSFPGSERPVLGNLPQRHTTPVAPSPQRNNGTTNERSRKTGSITNHIYVQNADEKAIAQRLAAQIHHELAQMG